MNGWVLKERRGKEGEETSSSRGKERHFPSHTPKLPDLRGKVIPNEPSKQKEKRGKKTKRKIF